MRKNIYKSIAICGISLLFFSCGEEQSYFQNVKSATEGSRLKFIHAASDAAGVNFYINDTKISSGGAAGSAIAYASSFPGINYSILPATQSTLNVLVPAAGTTPDNILTSTGLTIENNKYYTIAFSGIASKYDVVTINDDLSSVTPNGKSYVRFVNLIHNSANKLSVVATITSGTPAVTTNVTIAENVAYKESVNFLAVEPGDYTIQLKDAVTGTVVATASTVNKLLGGNRAYTLFARGQIGKTDAKVPTLDRLTNL